MKILFVSPSYKPAYIYGGPTVSVSQLAEALVKSGHEVTVYTTTANGKDELDVAANEQILVNGVKVFYCKRVTGDHTHVSFKLWAKLQRNASEFDIVHLHSWWSILIMVTAWICKRKKIRFVLSPRGMLGEYSFFHQHSSLKKHLHRLIGKKLLQASILHATTSLEWKDCTAIYPQWKGFILHNLIELPDQLEQPGCRHRPNKFRLGFLSRIDPKKGLELLFEALRDVSFSFSLKIAGTGESIYLENLKSHVEKLGISDHVEWCGWRSGNDKFNFFKELDLFVLPSYNENFAIVVPESLFAGTAVLVSDKVGLAEYVAEKKLGFICQPAVASIREKLEIAFQNKESLESIRQLAPGIVKKDFDGQTLAGQYAAAYRFVSNKLTEEAV